MRRLRARQVVALTGTPLENRLAELWSLLDATNPGLLGSRAGFGRRFAAPIERRRRPRGHTTAAPARGAVRAAPHEGRPRGRPRSAAQDRAHRHLHAHARAGDALPVVVDALAEIRAAAGIKRRGRILALLTALKQIGNHPVHAARGGPASAGRSGKLARARSSPRLAAGERLLVFTQFVVMGDLLARQLAEDLGLPSLPVPPRRRVDLGGRDRMVAGFQEDPESPLLLIVSTRRAAGPQPHGCDSQVVHYDRWWNPAVEDQATDRAHRIGQTRPVEVHKLVTAGTVEERIAELLERKRALAEAVVGRRRGLGDRARRRRARRPRRAGRDVTERLSERASLRANEATVSFERGHHQAPSSRHWCTSRRAERVAHVRVHQ